MLSLLFYVAFCLETRLASRHQLLRWFRIDQFHREIAIVLITLPILSEWLCESGLLVCRDEGGEDVALGGLHHVEISGPKVIAFNELIGCFFILYGTFEGQKTYVLRLVSLLEHLVLQLQLFYGLFVSFHHRWDFSCNLLDEGFHIFLILDKYLVRVASSVYVFDVFQDLWDQLQSLHINFILFQLISIQI